MPNRVEVAPRLYGGRGLKLLDQAAELHTLFVAPRLYGGRGLKLEGRRYQVGQFMSPLVSTGGAD